MSRHIIKNAYINESGERFLTNNELHKVANAFTFFQHDKNLTWIIVHNLNTSKIHVQIFENEKVIIPQNIHIEDTNTIKIVFSSPQAGKCLITGHT